MADYDYEFLDDVTSIPSQSYQFYKFDSELESPTGLPYLMPVGLQISKGHIRREIAALTEQDRLYNKRLLELQLEVPKDRRLIEWVRSQIRYIEEQIGLLEVKLEQQLIEGNGIVLKQKLNSFEISNDGYGVEVEKLFTRITKKTLVDIMKQLGEEENQHALMKKSKAVLMHYFMKNYASSQHTGNNVVADNRPKKREKFETVADKRFAMYQKERRQKGLEKMKQDNRMTEALISAPVKLSRPAPVRRKDVSL
jgi:hypothetical protein